jgi:hypothetical protein
MKVQYREEMANHSDPESCVAHREVWSEALAGETSRPAIEPRNQEIGMPTELTDPEGNTGYGANRKSYPAPARSKTLSMLGSDLHRSWEISAVPGEILPGGVGKVKDRNPAIYAAKKSDTPIVPKKLPNKGAPAEAVEGRGVANGNAGETPGAGHLVGKPH